MFYVKCCEAIPHQNLYNATTALKSHSLAGYKRHRHVKSVRKKKRPDIIWCFIRYISKHKAEMVHVQGVGLGTEAGSATYWLCELGRVTTFLRTFVSLFINGGNGTLLLTSWVF